MAFLKDVIYKPITGEWGTEGDKVGVIRTTNFTHSGVLDFSNVVKRDISDKKITEKKLIKGDIIIEKSGGSPTQPVGRVAFFEDDGLYLCNNFTSILRPKKDIVEPKYLHYLLFAGHKFRVTELFQNKTTGIINLQLSRYIEKVKIPLPPIETQKRIAEILDNATALRDKTKQLLEEYDQLAQSIFLEMFGDPVTNPMGWEKRKMGDLMKIVRGGSPRPIKNFLGGSIPWIKIGDATKGDDIFLHNTKEKIIEAGLSKTRLLPSGSLIFANCGVSLGFARIITFEGCIHDGWLAFSNFDENKVNKIFILKTLNSVTDYFRKTAPDGTQPNLNTSIMKSFEIIVPPIEMQIKFEKNIALISKQKELANNELKESEDLFQALLQKAFKGELV